MAYTNQPRRRPLFPHEQDRNTPTRKSVFEDFFALGRDETGAARRPVTTSTGCLRMSLLRPARRVPDRKRVLSLFNIRTREESGVDWAGSSLRSLYAMFGTVASGEKSSSAGVGPEEYVSCAEVRPRI